jgi:hypothetical protein
MMKRPIQSGVEIETIWLIVGAVGILFSIVVASWALGWLERTATPPLVALTVNQAGCDYAAQNGVATERHDSSCRITVRYRKDLFGEGGRILLQQERELQLNAGQVVGTVQLDDGSGQPWTAGHWWAAILLGASCAGMFLSLWVISRSASGRGRDES